MVTYDKDLHTFANTRGWDYNKLVKLGLYSKGGRIYIPCQQDYEISRDLKGKNPIKPKGKSLPMIIKGTNDKILITEGETDALAFKQHYPMFNVFALLGVNNYNFLKDLPEYFSQKKIILCFDNDDAGNECTANSIKLLLNNIKFKKYDVRVLKVPKFKKDIDDFLKQYSANDLMLELERVSKAGKKIESDNVIEYIQSKTDQKVEQGKFIRCINPTHDDKIPSMMVYKDHAYCYGCGYLVRNHQEKESPMTPEPELLVLGEVLAKGIPQIKWLVKDLIPLQGVTVFGGFSGQYKTWVAQHLALCVSQGKPFVNHFETRKGTVLYVDEENGLVTLPNRFAQLIKGHGLNRDIVNVFLSVFQGFKIDAADLSISNLPKIIEVIDPDIVICDSLVRLMTGDEDKSSDVRQIFDNIKSLSKDREIAFVILHHTTKSNRRTMDGLRGSGDLSAMADAVYMFHSKHKGYCTIDVVKNRHIDQSTLPNVTIKITSNNKDSVKLEYTENPRTGSAVGDCAADLMEWAKDNQIIQFRPKQLEKHLMDLGHRRQTMYDSLRLLCDEHKIKQTKRGVYEVQKDKVTEEDVEDE